MTILKGKQSPTRCGPGMGPDQQKSSFGKTGACFGRPGCHTIEARKSVVDQLWHLGVGEGRNCPTNKATQLEFLLSCRNARRLREVVLESFIRLVNKNRTSQQW